MSAEQQPSKEIFPIEPGLRAYPLPSLKLHYAENLNYYPPSTEEATNHLNGILESIERQFGQLRGVITREVTDPPFPTIGRPSREQRTFLIIWKSPSNGQP